MDPIEEMYVRDTKVLRDEIAELRREVDKYRKAEVAANDSEKNSKPIRHV